MYKLVKVDEVLVGEEDGLLWTHRKCPVVRRNSESTALRSLTMLQPCLQAVDLKVDRHFGKRQGIVADW